MNAFTLSLFVKAERPRPRRWWHRALGVEPLRTMEWERRHFTTQFPSDKAAIEFLGVLSRPETLAGMILGRGACRLSGAPKETSYIDAESARTNLYHPSGDTPLFPDQLNGGWPFK